MTNPTNGHDEVPIDEATGTADAAAPEAEASLMDAGPALLAAAQAEARDMKDRMLRTLAEMENLRKRTEREVADARTYGVT
ncbi:MAG: nucleotide exchange factor GrpE, partial [Hyphomicrobiales bacterium]